MQDIPGTEKTPPEMEILQHKVSEVLGIGTISKHKHNCFRN